MLARALAGTRHSLPLRRPSSARRNSSSISSEFQSTGATSVRPHPGAAGLLRRDHMSFNGQVVTHRRPRFAWRNAEPPGSPACRRPARRRPARRGPGDCACRLRRWPGQAGPASARATAHPPPPDAYSPPVVVPNAQRHAQDAVMDPQEITKIPSERQKYCRQLYWLQNDGALPALRGDSGAAPSP